MQPHCHPSAQEELGPVLGTCTFEERCWQCRWQSGGGQGSKKVLPLVMTTVATWRVVKRPSARNEGEVAQWSLRFLPTLRCVASRDCRNPGEQIAEIRRTYFRVCAVEILQQNFFLMYFLNFCYTNNRPRLKLKIKSIFLSTSLNSIWKCRWN